MESQDFLNTIDPTVAIRWVSEYENNENELLGYQARYREGRKPYVERRNAIIDRAVDSGLNRDAFKDELKTRALERKIKAISAGEGEEIAEQRELIRTALAGLANLPLGEAALKAAEKAPKAATAAAPAVFDFSTMPLDTARAILAAPKGKGRPSAKAIAQRAHAAKMVAEASPGASGAQAEAIAEAMGQDDAEPVGAAPDALSSLVDHDDNVTDIRPRFMRV